MQEKNWANVVTIYTSVSFQIRPDIGRDPDAGKDLRAGVLLDTEDEMIKWHHWLNGHEFEQTLGDSEGQGSLLCCSPWGRKDLDVT